MALVAEYADILQIGSRNMENYSLLEAAARSGRPMLLKRGMVATIADLLRSAQVILDNGNPNVILCERGIRTFETAMRNTFDAAAIALLKQISHLPVIADPSHAAGRRELVPALARIGVAAGADGLIVEVHPDPDKAWSDGEQSLDFAEFDAMMASLGRGSLCSRSVREKCWAAARSGARSPWRRWDEVGRPLRWWQPLVCDCCFRFADSRASTAQNVDADFIVTAAPVYAPLAELRGRGAVSQGRAIAAGA